MYLGYSSEEQSDSNRFTNEGLNLFDGSTLPIVMSDSVAYLLLVSNYIT